MSTGKIIAGVLAGVATGAVLGILFAPNKGVDTRKNIAKKGSDTVDEIKEKFNDLICSIENKVGDKDQFEELLKTLNKKFAAAKEEVLEMYEKGKAEVEAKMS